MRHDLARSRARTHLARRAAAALLATVLAGCHAEKPKTQSADTEAGGPPRAVASNRGLRPYRDQIVRLYCAEF
jgi:hypothetical protein